MLAKAARKFSIQKQKILEQMGKAESTPEDPVLADQLREFHLTRISFVEHDKHSKSVFAWRSETSPFNFFLMQELDAAKRAVKRYEDARYDFDAKKNKLTSIRSKSKIDKVGAAVDAVEIARAEVRVSREEVKVLILLVEELKHEKFREGVAATVQLMQAANNPPWSPGGNIKKSVPTPSISTPSIPTPSIPKTYPTSTDDPEPSDDLLPGELEPDGLETIQLR